MAPPKSFYLLFDFDGTLCDSLTVLLKLLNQYAPTFGYREIQSEEGDKFRGLSSKEIMTALCVPKMKIPILVLKIRKAFREYIPQLSPIAGIPEVLGGLHGKGVKMGILTSNAESNVSEFLQRNHLDFFQFVHSEHNLFGKARVIEHILDKYAWGRDSVVYVGDETRDIQAAKKCTIRSVGVTWGLNNREVLSKFNPEYLVDKPEELARIQF